MNQEAVFTYRYSANENREILEIRKKYLPQGESKLDELKRLDSAVQLSGIPASLCIGIISSLVLGFGMCLAMQIIGAGILTMALGIGIGLVGIAGMLAAYPVYRRIYQQTKRKHTPRILELTAELSGEKN